MTVAPDEIEEAFIKANPGLQQPAIAVICDRTRLSEVRICMSKDLQFRACDEIDRRACRRDKVVMPPVRGGLGARLLRGRPMSRRSTRMNYRHAFHAGNFADVVKHIVLVRILTLSAREAGGVSRHRHAMPARDFTISPAKRRKRTGEWRTGIARLMQAPIVPRPPCRWSRRISISSRSFNPPRGLTAYPGSPLIARKLLRPQDRLVACEVAPAARKRLIATLRRDPQARVAIDGWAALPAFVPPKERRGVVLIDPPFEAKDEFARMAQGFADAFAKWPTGIYVLWYPAKSRRATDTLAEQVAGIAPAGKVLRLEFSSAPQQADGALTSAGLLIVNSPWTLAAEMKAILPELEKPLGQGGAGRFRLETAKA